eukprot:9474706-Pyramimonas_sp.AAC.1
MVPSAGAPALLRRVHGVDRRVVSRVHFRRAVGSEAPLPGKRLHPPVEAYYSGSWVPCGGGLAVHH